MELSEIIASRIAGWKEELGRYERGERQIILASGVDMTADEITALKRLIAVGERALEDTPAQ